MALLYHNHNHNHSHVGMGPNPVFSRSSELFGYADQNYMMIEKRQLFLRSYQFSRKRSLSERIKGSFVKAKRVIWLRLRSARKLRKLVWSRLRFAFYCRRKTKFLRLLSNNKHHHTHNSSCFW